jgi:hypothetical protein
MPELAAILLTPCKVPWAISPSGSEVTLSHTETDIAPECKVTFGAGRLTDDNRTDCRHVEILFEACYFTRTGPKSDNEGIESVGYEVTPRFEGKMDDYLNWRTTEWRRTGNCPTSGFYVALRSVWLESIPEPYVRDAKHYVIEGRDGYVELIARSFKWRELSSWKCDKAEA